MKRIGIGDITRSGGINRFLNEVQSTGEPLVIMRTNEPVVILLPTNDAITNIFESSYTLGKVINEFVKEGRDADVEFYLLNQMLLGMQSESLFVSLLGYEKVQKLKKNLFVSMAEAVNSTLKISSEEVGTAGEQPAAPSKGSKTEKGAVKRSPIRKKKK
jgi:hypothetical protein